MKPAGAARRATIRFGAFVFVALLLLAPGHLYSIDDETNFRLTESLALRGTLTVDAVADRHLNLSPGRSGHLYSYYAPATSVLGLPFYALGRLLAWLLGVSGYYVTRACFSLQGQLWGALGAVFLRRALLSLGANEREAGIVACLHAFGTYAFFQSRTVMTGFPVGCLNLWVLGTLLRADDFRSGWRAGLALSLAFLYRYDSAILWPLWLLGGARFAPGVILGLLPGVACGALYNTLRFGLPWATGAPDVALLFQGDWLVAFCGLTVLPGRGVFWYSPLSLAGLCGLFALAGLAPRRRRLVLALALVQFVFVIFLPVWTGGGTWGPRHFGAVLPLLSLGLLPLWRGARAWVRWAGVSAALLLQLYAAVVSPDSWHDLLWDYGVPYDRAAETLRYNPWRGQYEVLRRVTFERLHVEYRQRAVPAGATPANQIVRRSLDFWPVYAWKMNMPLAAIGGAWLALLAACAALARRTGLFTPSASA